jgi:hypothetical protein
MVAFQAGLSGQQRDVYGVLLALCKRAAKCLGSHKCAIRQAMAVLIDGLTLALWACCTLFAPLREGGALSFWVQITGT